MNTILKYLLDFADRMGVVDELMCYGKDLLVVSGRTRTEEKKFSITLRFEGGKENA
jgi:hypothetical protein